MKNSLKFLGGALAVFGGALVLSAQSAPLDHLRAASGDASRAVGNSAVALGQLTGGVAAIPLWMSGAVTTATGESLVHVGSSATKAGDEVWDFANGGPGKRPPLDREKCVPAKAPTVKTKDPSPAEAFQAKT
ncbi:MAG TPA: hypothetical protein VHD32_06855 [Candidatus Didemnitutus sp.]|nr:hypothetical protein [Candidatus Didemnitutus sp.]